MVVVLAAAVSAQARAQVAPAPSASSIAADRGSGQPAKTNPSNPAKPVAVRPSSDTAVEQIVVTANKRRELQRNVANSVTAITGKTLERRQDTSIQDLASQVPGLSVQVADKTQVRIVLRGLNTGSVGTEVASVLDDVPTSAESAQNNAGVNSSNFDTYDLSRIEVLQGPQGTLYGATAEGGIVKYVTNPPTLGKHSAALESGVSGATDGGIGGSLKGFVNIPLVKDFASIRLTGWNEWIPGFIDNPEAGKTNANSGHQYGWRASLLVEPTSALYIRLTAERQTLFSNNTDLIQAVGAARDPMAPPANQLSIPNGLVNNSRLSNTGQNEAAVYYADINYDFGWSNLTSITSYTFNDVKTNADASNTNIAAGVDYADYLDANAYGVPLVIGERQNSNLGKFNQEVRLTNDPGLTVLGRQFEWLGGAFYTHENTAFLQYLDARDAGGLGVLAPPAGGVAEDAALSSWAVFGQIDYHLIPTFDVSLGGRFSGTAQHSQTIYGCCVLYGPTRSLGEVNSNDHDALYSVAPRWRPTDNTMVYGRIATGYRPGGANIPVPGIAGLPNTYQPDRTVNYEVGVRQDLFDKKVAVDVTGFYVNWKNVQILSVFNTPEGPFSVNGNAGSASSKGVEWTLRWVPLHGLTLSTSGEYTDARLTKNAPGLGAFAGDYLPYVPDVTNSVNVEYDWNLLGRYPAYVSGTWSYTGVRSTDFSPTTTVTVSHLQLPSYNTGAIRAGVDIGRYGLELFLKNLSDSRGITFYTNEGGAGETGQLTIIQPRTVGLVLRIRM